MTGPLAPLFAHVREALFYVGYPDGGYNAERDAGVSALSSIERHVQEQDELQQRIDSWIIDWKYGALDASLVLPAIAREIDESRAALPASGTPEGDAREKEESR